MTESTPLTKKLIRNVHIYPSYLTNESRILRECDALVQLGLVGEAIVIGFWKPGLLPIEEVSNHVTFKRLSTGIGKGGGKLKFLNYLSFPIFYLKVLILCIKLRPSIVNSHTLTVLPLGVILKWVLGCKLIYDPHELETETNDSKGLRKKVSKILERTFIPFADWTIVVGNRILNWYKTTYNLSNISIVRNIPKATSDPKKTAVLRSLLGLTDRDIVLLYVGSLENGRGVDLLLKTFEQIDDKHLVFVGYGSLSPRIKQISNTNSRVHILDAVPPGQVIEIVSGADVGISLIENTCLSYYYCLPNKCYEYVTAGIPFISSAFPELMDEFGEYDVAWFAQLEEESIRSLIDSITLEEIQKKRARVMTERGRWKWDLEREKYRDVYQKLVVDR